MAVSKTKVEAWLDRIGPPFSLTFFPDVADGSCSKPCSSTSIKIFGLAFMAVSKTKVEAWLDRIGPPFSLTFFPDVADGSCSKPCSSTSIKKTDSNSFLKQDQGRKSIFSLPQFPLSLALTLPELVDGHYLRPSSSSSKTTIKHCDFGLLCNVVLGIISAYITTHLLSWNVQWPQKNHVYCKFQSYVIQLLCRNGHWAQKNDVYKKFRSYITAVTQFFRTTSRTGPIGNMLPLMIIDAIVHPILNIISKFPLRAGRIGKQSVSWGKMDWQNLPLEMCAEIGRRSTSKVDVLQFRSVCKKWRMAVGHPILFPRRVPRMPNCEEQSQDVVYRVNEVNYYHNFGVCGICGYLLVNTFEFLVLQEWGLSSNRYYMASLSSPNTQPWRKQLFMNSRRKNPLFGLHFFARMHHISVGIIHTDPDSTWVEGRPRDAVLSMVIISSPEAEAKGVNSNYISLSHLSAVVLMWGKGCRMNQPRIKPMQGRLALLRLGGEDKWDTGFCNRYFVSITVWRERLCAMDESGAVYVMDYHSLRMTRVCGPANFRSKYYQKQLFEHEGGLYAMDYSKLHPTPSYLLSPRDFHFYKVDFESGKWVHDTKFRPRIWESICITHPGADPHGRLFSPP